MSQSKGVPYYYNTESKEAAWDPPAGVDPKSLKGADLLDNGQVRASHLLVKHRDSRRPASWKEVSLHTRASLLPPFSLAHHVYSQM